jgi:DNA end-binding protein Ku
MAPRPNWKGYLKLSLVSCPIALYPAISAAERVSFRQVNRQTGNRLRHQLVDAVTGEPVAPEDKGRGYEIGENEFLLVKDEELETAQQVARTLPFSAAPATSPAAREEAGPTKRAEPAPPAGEVARQPAAPAPQPAPVFQPPPAPVRVENTRTIEIERFVPRAQIDPRYYDTPYYITPRDQVGQEAYAVIRDAMRREGMVGMGRVVLAKRERPIIIEPLCDGLQGVTLHYAHEVRSEAEYFADVPKLGICLKNRCVLPNTSSRPKRLTSIRRGWKTGTGPRSSRCCERKSAPNCRRSTHLRSHSSAT